MELIMASKQKITRYIKTENVEKLRLGSFTTRKSQSKILDELIEGWC